MSWWCDPAWPEPRPARRQCNGNRGAQPDGTAFHGHAHGVTALVIIGQDNVIAPLKVLQIRPKVDKALIQ